MGLFVTGLEKSGKTPLRRLLGSQPGFELSRLRLWSRFDGRCGDLRDQRALDDCLATIRAAGIAFDAESVRLRMTEGPAALRTYAGLFGSIARDQAEAGDRTVWGDQAAEIEAAADELLAAFPAAMILHLIRDPRDRFCESRGAERRGGLGPAVASWMRSSRRARTNLTRHPDRYRVIRYEDLVHHPSDVLTRITSLAGDHDPIVDEAIVPPPESIGRYRQLLSDGEVDYIQRASGDEMRRWDYEVDDVTLGLLRSVRARLLERPLRDARARGWLHRERHQSRAGRVVTSEEARPT